MKRALMILLALTMNLFCFAAAPRAGQPYCFTAAADLTDFFTDQPDFTPYTVRPVDARVFDPEKIKTGGGSCKYMSAPLDDPEIIEREHWERIEAEKSGG